MNKTTNNPRPTVRQFLGCCRTEFAFLADYRFREVRVVPEEHPDPYRFRMVCEYLELYAHDINYGSRTSVRLRDSSGHEFAVSQIIPASRTALRLVRRRHPDGQRADIAAAARALRESPDILAAQDLAPATRATPNEGIA